MPVMVATLLGAIIIAFLAVDVSARMQRSLEESLYTSEMMQAAFQQSTFARAVAAYIHANGTPAGTVLTVASVVSTLGPGFPAENPFGQTPEAFVGSNSVAIITYTAAPSASVLSAFGLNAASAMTLQSVAYDEADDIAAVQAGSPQFAGSMLNNGTLSTPFLTFDRAASNYVTGVGLPAGPVFADLLNVLPVPSTSSSGTTGYSPATGD